MNNEEKNRFIVEQVLGDCWHTNTAQTEGCFVCRKSKYRCNKRNPDFYADNGKAWEQIQRVLAKLNVEDVLKIVRAWFTAMIGRATKTFSTNIDDYDVDAVCADLLTAKPSEIADAIIEVMKED